MADSEDTSAPAASPPSDTLGEQLRNARLAQDLTLEQLSTELRIEVKQLQALEDDRFEQIGVPVFVKGYLKQYGTRLGLDVSDLLTTYYKQTTLADIQIQPSRTIKLSDRPQLTSRVLIVIVLLAIAGGLAAWWWSGGTFALPSSLLPQPDAEPAAPPVSLAPPEPEAPARPTPAVAARESLPVAEPPSAPVAELAGDTPAPAVAAAPPAAPSSTAENSQAAPVVAIPLQFTFEQESWAEVTDARGERLLFGLNAAGRDVTVRGEPPFAIVLGNADSVRLIVDGAPYAIPTVGRQGNLARFAVDIAEE